MWTRRALVFNLGEESSDFPVAVVKLLSAAAFFSESERDDYAVTQPDIQIISAMDQCQVSDLFLKLHSAHSGTSEQETHKFLIISFSPPPYAHTQINFYHLLQHVISPAYAGHLASYIPNRLESLITVILKEKPAVWWSYQTFSALL